MDDKYLTFDSFLPIVPEPVHVDIPYLTEYAMQTTESDEQGLLCTYCVVHWCHLASSCVYVFLLSFMSCLKCGHCIMTGCCIVIIRHLTFPACLHQFIILYILNPSLQ